MHRRGIVLITGLLFVVLISFFVLASLRLSPGALHSAQAFQDRQLALQAAQSGLEYAKTRLREDSLWRGGDSGPVQTVASPDGSLVVYEDHGNVVGILRSGTQNYSQFRIRFNHQGGTTDHDNLDNPSSDFLLDFPGISSNNLSGAAPIATYQQGSSGVVLAPGRLPQFQARILVEGRCGDGLRGLSPDRVNPPLEANRIVSVRLEADLRGGFGSTLDAVVMAGSDFQATISPGGLPDNDPEKLAGKRRVRLDGNRRDGPPKVRAKGKVSVTGGQSPNLFASRNSEVRTATSDLEAGTVANPRVALEQEEPGAGFYRLSWDEVKKADPASDQTVRLKAGTYVVNDDGNNSVDYYDLSYEDYKSAVLSGSPPAPT